MYFSTKEFILGIIVGGMGAAIFLAGTKTGKKAQKEIGKKYSQMETTILKKPKKKAKTKINKVG